MKKKKIVVLGSGLVGSTIAADLHRDFDVTAVDRDNKSLEKLKEAGIKTFTADLSDNGTLYRTISAFDIVVGALPGFMGYKMIKLAIEEKKDVVDISFCPEDPMQLDQLARQNGVTVVTDCGVAPGMSNIILGYYNNLMKVENYECYVGGLPFLREWPYEYKAVFSPLDVIEEYVRPARYIENGNLIVREALSDPELMHFDNIGTLEAWNSDGLRSLIKTMKVPRMIEKTLRYPGCIEYLKVLRETGFFSTEPVDIDGAKIRPVDLTAKLLFPKWEMKSGEEDFTVMRIIIDGIKNGEEKRYIWNMFDKYDRTTETLSMARTTGFTCNAAVNLLASGKYLEKGVSPPEYLGKNIENFTFIINYLRERKVIYNVDEK